MADQIDQVAQLLLAALNPQKRVQGLSHVAPSSVVQWLNIHSRGSACTGRGQTRFLYPSSQNLCQPYNTGDYEARKCPLLQESDQAEMAGESQTGALLTDPEGRRYRRLTVGPGRKWNLLVASWRGYSNQGTHCRPNDPDTSKSQSSARGGYRFDSRQRLPK